MAPARMSSALAGGRTQGSTLSRRLPSPRTRSLSGGLASSGVLSGTTSAHLEDCQGSAQEPSSLSPTRTSSNSVGSASLRDEGSSSPFATRPSLINSPSSARCLHPERDPFGIQENNSQRPTRRWSAILGSHDLIAPARNNDHTQGDRSRDIPRRPKRTRSNDLSTPYSEFTAQSLAQAAAQASSWGVTDSRKNIMGTVVFHVIALRALVLGLVAGVILLGVQSGLNAIGVSEWLGLVEQGSCAVAMPSNAQALQSLEDGRLSCRDAKLHDQVHLIGSDLHVTWATSLTECCAKCTQRRACIALSYNIVQRRCVLFKGTVSEAMQSSWTRSFILQPALAQADMGNVRAARETERWDVEVSFQRALAPPSFTVETQYRDPVSRNKRTRTDYRDHVAGALRDLGLVPIALPTDVTTLDVIWGLHWDSQKKFTSAGLHSWQLLNMVPGVLDQTIGEKDSLHRLVQDCRKRYGTDLVDSFMPRSYMLPEDEDEIVDPNAIWIWKPLRSWSGDGISVLTGEHAKERLLRKRSSSQTNVILQTYILNPLTLSGYKFDTRWWVVITSVNPLRVYSVEDAYVRPAAVPYRSDIPGLADKCVHVTNGKVFKQCKGSKSFPIKRVNDPLFMNKLRDAYNRDLDPNLASRIEKTLISRTQIAMLKTLLLSLPILKQTHNWTAAQHFQLLAFDIIYDSDTGAPWVEEVNSNGFLGTGMIEVSSAVGSDILRDMFTLVGVAGYDRSAYQTSLERYFMRDSGSEPPSLDILSPLQAAIDELYASQRSWKMLYPLPLRESSDTDIQSLIRMADHDASHAQLLRDVLASLPGSPAVLGYVKSA